MCRSSAFRRFGGFGGFGELGGLGGLGGLGELGGFGGLGVLGELGGFGGLGGLGVHRAGVFAVEDLRSSTGGFDLGVVTGRQRAQVRDSSSIRGRTALAYRVLQDRSSPRPPHHTALTRKGQQPMSKHQNDPFSTIDSTQLEKVGGGASRVSSRTGGSNDQLMTMLTQVTDSIKDLAKNQSSGGMDPMMMIMIMMMIGGDSGSGDATPVAAPAPAPLPVINVSTSTRRCF